mmetsp:Transcript_95577/g.308318  ORF Transcript_95577/g.308318 Transcript_95577/m.308318 type:complete len:381 (+) Transcript_95577:598-1740(+)
MLIEMVRDQDVLRPLTGCIGLLEHAGSRVLEQKDVQIKPDDVNAKSEHDRKQIELGLVVEVVVPGKRYKEPDAQQLGLGLLFGRHGFADAHQLPRRRHEGQPRDANVERSGQEAAQPMLRDRAERHREKHRRRRRAPRRCRGPGPRGGRRGAWRGLAGEQPPRNLSPQGAQGPVLGGHGDATPERRPRGPVLVQALEQPGAVAPRSLLGMRARRVAQAGEAHLEGAAHLRQRHVRAAAIEPVRAPSEPPGGGERREHGVGRAADELREGQRCELRAELCHPSAMQGVRHHRRTQQPQQHQHRALGRRDAWAILDEAWGCRCGAVHEVGQGRDHNACELPDGALLVDGLPGPPQHRHQRRVSHGLDDAGEGVHLRHPADVR